MMTSCCSFPVTQTTEGGCSSRTVFHTRWFRSGPICSSYSCRSTRRPSVRVMDPLWASTHSGPQAHTGLQSPLHSVLDSPGPERSLQNQMNLLLSLMKPCADTSLPLLLHYGKIFSHDIIALDFRVRRLNMFPPGSHVTFGFHGSPAARDAF